MSQRNRARLDRIESRYSGNTQPRVVLIPTDVDGSPVHASFQDESLKPNPGETLEQFEERAEQHFNADHVISIVSGKFDSDPAS